MGLARKTWRSSKTHTDPAIDARNVRVVFDVGDVRTFLRSIIGVLQGDVLAPLLYILFKACVNMAWRRRQGNGDDAGGVTFATNDELDVRKRLARRWESPKDHFRVSEVLYADDLAIYFETFARLRDTAPLFVEHCRKCGLIVHFATDAKPTSKSEVVYHGPSGDIGLNPERGDLLLDREDNEYHVWRFERRERRDDLKQDMGWYHNADEAEGTTEGQDGELSTMGEIRKWRREWARKRREPQILRRHRY
jgi:hypothetical protein